MKRVVGAAITLSLVVSQVPANAATKVGSQCSKSGAATTVKGVKLVCSKSGKKLIWAKAPTTKPTPTALPSAKDPLDVLLLPASPGIGSSCLTNGDEQFATVGPIRCVDRKWTLVALADDSVMTRSFRAIWNRWQQVKADPLASEIVIDQKTPAWRTWAALGYEGGARYWRATPENMLVRAVVSADANWIDSKAKELGWIAGETFKNARDSRPWDSIAINKGTPDGDPVDKPWAHILLEGEPHVGVNTIAHEFGHVAQIYFSRGKFFRTPSRVPWLDEGMPSLVGAALSPLVGMRYNTRDEWVDRMISADVKLFDVSDTKVTPGSSPLFWRAYAAGFFASEALIALYGSECLDDIYRGVSNGSSWNESFIRVFGLTIEETSNALDQYVQSVRAKKPMTLLELSNALKRIGAKVPPNGWIS